jgi:hypothetical protein
MDKARGRSNVESNQTTRPRSVHLRVGIGTLGVAGVYVVSVLLLGWPGPFLLALVALLSLLFGGIAVFAGLVLKANRRRVRLWMHFGVFLANVVLLYVLSIGPGNYFGLMDSRTRLAVALTGGQGKLQAWAVDLLAKPREGMEEDGQDWRVPKQYWSEQVHRLRPNSVDVVPLFEDRRWAVCLNYGSAFFHWSIVAGPPGSRPDPKSSDPNSDNTWYRWCDGLYDWQQP